MIEQHVVEDVKHRTDIVAVIGQHVPLRKAGGNFVGLCPFHNEKTPSFNVSPGKNMFYCYGCHKGGDAITFVREFQGMDFEEAVRSLGQMCGIDVPEYTPPGGQAPDPRARGRRERMLELHDRLNQWYQEQLRSPAGREAMDYLLDRGLTDDWIVAFGLGYAPDSYEAVLRWGEEHGYDDELMIEAGVITVKDPDDPRSRIYDRWRHRIMFPIHDAQGKVVAFSGRMLDSERKGGKYVNSPETPIFHKSRILYGLHRARDGIKQHGGVLICEGQMDVIACHRAGLTNAVAPQGTAFTEDQVRLLKRYTDQLIFCFDSDKAGINAALKSSELWAPAEMNARVVVLGEGNDPDSLIGREGHEALQRRVGEAVDYFTFLLDELCKQHDPKHPQGKQAIVEAYLEHVVRLTSPILRSEYSQMVATRLQIQEAFVFQVLKRFGARARRQALPRQREPEPELLDDAPPPGHGITMDATELSLCATETELLDLALHHEPLAHTLATALAHDDVSRTPMGTTLNRVIGHVLQGEWHDIIPILQEELGELPPEAVQRLMESHFPADTADPRVQKAFNDSLYSHVLARVTRDLAAARGDMMRTISLTQRRNRLESAKKAGHPYAP